MGFRWVHWSQLSGFVRKGFGYEPTEHNQREKKVMARAKARAKAKGKGQAQAQAQAHPRGAVSTVG